MRVARDVLVAHDALSLLPLLNRQPNDAFRAICLARLLESMWDSERRPRLDRNKGSPPRNVPLKRHWHLTGFAGVPYDLNLDSSASVCLTRRATSESVRTLRDREMLVDCILGDGRVREVRIA